MKSVCIGRKMSADLKEFKNKILKYAIITAILAQIISIPFIGLNFKFSYGLIFGTVVAIVNFTILEAALQISVKSNSAAVVIIIGYFVRITFYCVSFYVCITTSYLCGAGAAIGYMTIKVAIYYIHGFRSKFSIGRIVKEEQECFKEKNPCHCAGDGESEGEQN